MSIKDKRAEEFKAHLYDKYDVKINDILMDGKIHFCTPNNWVGKPDDADILFYSVDEFGFHYTFICTKSMKHWFPSETTNSPDKDLDTSDIDKMFSSIFKDIADMVPTPSEIQKKKESLNKAMKVFFEEMKK